MKLKAERQYFLDWLRFILILVLIFSHVVMIFDPSWGYYINNQDESEIFHYWILFVKQFYISLFFCIAGISTFFALKFRTPNQYTRERVQRLMIPFIFGTLVIVPPLVYFQRVQDSEFKGNYLEFYLHLFNGFYPEGNFGWHHLYFILNLFLYSLIALPLFLYLNSKKGEKTLSQIGSICDSKGGIFLLAIPLIVIKISLSGFHPILSNFIEDITEFSPIFSVLDVLEQYPGSHWSDFFLYFVSFLYGYLLFREQRLWEAIKKNKWISFILSVILIFLIYLIEWTETTPAADYSPGYVVYYSILGLATWSLVITFLGLTHHFLNFKKESLRYLNEAMYPIYIIHQTIIVIVGYYVIQWNTGIIEKFSIILIFSTLLILVAYHFIVRKINILRFLFGMKAK
ncbi:MAG: acyltransferase family protein [Candidatus Hodarchaeales archaeon]